MIGPNDLPATGWTRVAVAAIWATELLPLLEGSPALQKALEETMAHWIAGLHPNLRPERPWRWADPDCPPPFMTAKGDGAVVMVDARIRAAAEAFDGDAMAHDALLVLLSGDADIGLPEAVKDLLWTKMAAIWDRFAPQREEVIWVRPDGSCHQFVDFELALAQAWRPESAWQIASSKWHSTVVALDEKLIFDLVLLADETDTDPDEPVAFVRGEGQAVAEILECRRINKNAQARMRRRAQKGGRETP